MKNISRLIVLFVLSGLTGCLGVEKKEYTIILKDGQSGTATIKYVNIFSTDDNEKDVSFKDFGEMISDYYEGNKIEQDFPGIRNVKKRLFVENNTLCGEISFAFDSLSHAHVFRFDDGPFMYFVNSGSNSSEKIEWSNGHFGGDRMPVLFWKRTEKELRFKTVVTEDVTGKRNLVKLYKLWQSSMNEGH